jgi:hypothetical protein
MLNSGGTDEFVYRRDARVRMPLLEATWLKDGVRYLVPEIQLLFKSKGLREKDEQDFRDCLPLLSREQKSWLAEALRKENSTHEWLGRL